MHDLSWVYVAGGLLIGGILKGATGAGAPIVAVPVLAMLYDVPFAIAMLTFPILFSNIWQAWRFRASQGSKLFVWLFAGSAAIGAAIGTVLLVSLPSKLLFVSVSVAVLVYIAFRLARPQWSLSERLGRRLVAPMGFLSGVMQGAAGISAPVSLTFLTALRMERARFIATVSVFFTVMAIVQIPALASLGVMDGHRAALSLLACVRMFGGMPIGAMLARHLSPKTFERVIFVLLTVVALRLIFEAIWG